LRLSGLISIGKIELFREEKSSGETRKSNARLACVGGWAAFFIIFQTTHF
jgi:hypothetical protein